MEEVIKKDFNLDLIGNNAYNRTTTTKWTKRLQRSQLDMTENLGQI